MWLVTKLELGSFLSVSHHRKDVWWPLKTPRGAAQWLQVDTTTCRDCRTQAGQFVWSSHYTVMNDTEPTVSLQTELDRYQTVFSLSRNVLEEWIWRADHLCTPLHHVCAVRVVITRRLSLLSAWIKTSHSVTSTSPPPHLHLCHPTPLTSRVTQFTIYKFILSAESCFQL